MARIFFSALLIISSSVLFAQSADETAIHTLMSKQVTAWNNGSIDDFMKGYWNNDSLAFVGHDGITYGYQHTIDHYKKNYPTTDKMGKLFFF